MNALKLSALALGLFAASLSGAAWSQEVGVSMPTLANARWINDGNNIVASLEKMGHTAELVVADDEIPTQIAQIEGLITKGVKVLVIASVDGNTLSDVLGRAQEAGIKVVAYDRLILNTDHVDYYTTFDNFNCGVIHGESLISSLGLAEGKGPYNIELFGGSPDDNNAYFFYDGAMSVLQKYIDNGQLVVKSGQFGMEKVGTPKWDAANAQARMDNLLSGYYSDGTRLDAVLSPYDGLTTGILSSLKGVGYGTAELPFPVITGQDAEVQGVKAIIAGEQTSTIFKDTRALGLSAAEIVKAILEGTEPPINDTTTYNNGVKVVPSNLLKAELVTKDNWQSVLVDSGYYKLEDLQ